jgi:hypothetical protein
MKIAIICALLLVWVCAITYLYVKKPYLFLFQIVLHTILFTVLYLFVFPFNMATEGINNKICIVDNSQTQKAISSLKDSIGISEFLSAAQFKSRLLKGNFQNKNLILAGTNFDSEFLARLANYSVEHWVDFKPNEVQSLNYQGILEQNEMQIIQFTVDVEKSQFAKVRLGSTTLDSVLLHVGQNSAELSFPVFGIGRNEMMLEIGESKIGIRFFGIKSIAKNIKIRTSSPDFEFKTLAEWLTKGGHNVQLITDVSKNTNSEITFAQDLKGKEIDLYICSPDKISEKAKAKAVFVMGLVTPEKYIALINRTLGVNFNIQKKGNAIKTLKNGAEVLPFVFNATSSQFYAPELEIIGQNSRVGTTLLRSTYPLILAGDSMTYAKIWNNLFQILPKPTNTWRVDSPVLQNISSKISNSNKSDSIKIENREVLNINGEAKVFFKNAGWKPLGDSVEIYVDDNNYFYGQLKSFKSSIANSKPMFSNNIKEAQVHLIPVELLFILFLLVYGGIWLINRK